MKKATVATATFAAFAVVFTLAACAGPQSGQSPTVDVATARSEATVDDGTIGVDKYYHLANIENVEKLVDLDANDSVPWVVLAKDLGSPTVFVAYQTNLKAECGEHLGMAVIDETDSEVTIAAVNSQADPSVRCGENGSSVDGGYFELRQPLGERKIIHAGVTKGWEGGELLTKPGPVFTKPPVIKSNYSGPATCTSLLDKGAVEKLKSQSLHEFGDEWKSNIGSQPNLVLYSFLQTNGLICAWGDGDAGVIVAWSPISAKESKAQTKLFVDAGFKKERVGGIDIYSSEMRDNTARIAFGDGFWAYADNPGEVDLTKERDLLLQVAANAPKP